MSRQQQLMEGLDAYLQRVGKDLPVGGKIRLRLVQGPLPTASIDPVEISATSTGLPPVKQSFPSVLKFPPSSTQPPNFTQAPWCTGQGRLHIENVPKPQEDSDDEENGNKSSSHMSGTSDSNNAIAAGDGGLVSSSSTSHTTSSTNKTAVGKKRWKYNRNLTPAKQWIIQDQVDFFETMVYRRKQLKYQKLMAQYRKRRMTHPHEVPPPIPPSAPVPPPVRSSRYVGIPERMTSHHVLMTLQPPPKPPHQKLGYEDQDMADGDDEDRDIATITVRTLPSMDHPIMVPMTQPAVRSHSAFATLSNAAQVMEDQRFAMSVTAARLAFRNARPKLANETNHNNDGTTLRVGGIRKINKTQSRLLQKLQQKEKMAEEEDGDDVMADVAYKERKGSSGGARRELLSTLGDGLKVSDDGVVLGGTNDALFGGRGLKFNRLAVQQTDTSTSANNDNNNKTERGADGAAMSDDFYTRDVGAEYEEMDYDAAEQFDDDDVDVGETEVHNVGTDGYNDDEDDDDNDYDSDDMNDDDDDEAVGGVEGLASMKGYQALLAKARGEIQETAATTEKREEGRASSPTNVNNNGTNGGSVSATATLMTKKEDNETNSNSKRSVSPKPDKSGTNSDGNNKPMDHLEKKRLAAEKAKREFEKTLLSSNAVVGAANGGNNTMTTNPNTAQTAAPQVDEHGLRLITLDAVRKEIWLNHGSIPINRLIKIFNANKKHGEVRQNQLKQVIKELCTMTNDPIHGRMLVLKQHYSK
jgi:hypothetical protein